MASPAISLFTPAPMPNTTTSFFTSRRYSPVPSSSLAYNPQTPSPLRVSRNANAMPPLTTPAAPTKSSPLDSIENISGTASVTENTFNISPSLSTSNPSSKKSIFSQRARSHSPAAELSSRTSAARDRRKSLFLEQIRTRREDAKFEVRGDQVLRLDWARQEAERKARLARQAQRLPQLELDLDEDSIIIDEEDEHQPRDGPSPTEERELEELIRLHDRPQQYSDWSDEDMMDDLDAWDYDQLFMEMISANQDQQSQTQPALEHLQQQQSEHHVWSQQGSSLAPQSAHGDEHEDEVMDMS